MFTILAYSLALIAVMIFTFGVHEAGHVMAILFTHAGRLKGIVVSWKGIGIKWKPYAYEPLKRAAVSLAGPAVNMALAVLFYSVGLELLGLANLVFGVVNLMPLPGSDGLRVASNLSSALS